MPDNASGEKDMHYKQLKRKMECWREVILSLNSIFLWERVWYPGLIFGFTTIIFCMIWILEPALLTIVSITLLALALVDYFVPILTSICYSSDSWNGQKEKKLNEICQNLSVAILQLQNMWNSMVQIRNNRSNIYYGVTAIILLLLAWLGNTINNLFLFYIAVTGILLTPGLRHKGRARSAVKFMYDYITHRKLS